jgi:hypothetical protein
MIVDKLCRRVTAVTDLDMVVSSADQDGLPIFFQGLIRNRRSVQPTRTMDNIKGLSTSHRIWSAGGQDSLHC